MNISAANLAQIRQIPDRNRAIASGKTALKTLEIFKEDFKKELDGSAIASEFLEIFEFVSNTEMSAGHDCNDPIATALNWNRKQAGFSRRDDLLGAIFKNEDGSTWQVKLSRSLEPDKKPYLAPKGKGAKAFLPAISLEIWRKIAAEKKLPIEAPWLNYFKSLEESAVRIEKKQSEFLSENGSPIKAGLENKTFSSSNFQQQESPIFQGFAKNSKVNILYFVLSQLKALESLILEALRSFLNSARGDLPVPNFWDFIEANPSIKITLTEGGKKSLALLSQGYVAIALYGARAGVSKYETKAIAGEKIRRLKPELIGDLKRFVHADRPWLIALDQDTKPSTVSDVNKAIADLAFCLERDTREAAELALEKAKKSEDKEEKKAAKLALKQVAEKVSIVQWNGQNGRCKGVDDLIFNEGVKAWENALEGAVSAPEWRVTQRLKSAVKRKPDLHIGSREFKEVAADLPSSGLVALHGGKGTGKSEAIAAMVQSRTWLSFTALRSVARDQAAGFGGVFVNDGDRYGDRLLDSSGHPVNGGSVCIPSLLKVQRIAADVLVLDETTPLTEFLLISKLANKDGLRPLLLAEFIRRVQAAQLVILADADMTQEIIEWIEGIRGDRCYLVRSDRHALTYEASVIDGSQNEAIVLLKQRVEGLPDGKLIYINCDSKALAKAFCEVLGIQHCLLIDADTSGDAIQSSFLASKGKDIPELIALGIKFIISSPSVVQGFSITHNTELIDSVWGFYSGCSITAHGMAQGLDRPRSSEVPRFIWAAPRGRAYSKLSKAQSSGAFLKEFKQLNSAAARLVAHSLTPDTIAAVDSLDWQGQNLKMLASLEVRRNQGMMELRHTLIALLKHEGKTVTTLKPTGLKKAAKAIGRELKAAGQAIKTAHYEAVAAATELTEIEAIALSEKSEALTPDQLLSLERYYLAEFYRLEQVNFENASFDKSGKTRSQIRRLEMILKKQLADDRTAATINKSPDCPQDWNAATVQCWLLEMSGAAPLVQKIYAREVESYSAADLQEISEFFKAHATEFKIAFNFSNIGSVSPVQAIGVILDWYGIKRTRKHTIINGERKEFYEVDKAHLAKLADIIDRRGKVNTPTANERGIEKGVLPENPGITAPNSIPIAPDTGQGQGQDFSNGEDREVRYG